MEKIAMNALIFFAVGVVLTLLIGEGPAFSVGIVILFLLSVIIALLIKIVQQLEKTKKDPE
ncbi:hypothetical protein LCM20_09735 [Halobacillus litoralis]|uniref:hypothetical protein n=1 Tax=Halobacillus litoralis TaxID=45668 RepID=UPI001CD22A53|nr:hypothetical protein [Halobacillus litoralis]MCA0970870.1 hypothetical protein [Halobacillus litoralis]